MPTAVTGVESIEFAPISGNGTMPTTGFVKVVDIEIGSVTIDVPPIERNNIRVEDKPGIRFVLPGETDPPTINLNSLDLGIDNANLLFKGEATTGATKFEAPTNDEIHYLAMRLTSQPFQGKKFQMTVPVAAIAAGFANSFTKDGFVALSGVVTVTTPVDNNGNALSPWAYEFINATPTT